MLRRLFIMANISNSITIMSGAVIPFYNVTFQGRYPVFWGKSAPDTGWLICDGGDDLNGGTVPNLLDKFILGTTDVTKAKETGGSSTTGNTTAGGTISNTAAGGTIGATTLTTRQIPSHTHLQSIRRWRRRTVVSRQLGQPTIHKMDHGRSRWVRITHTFNFGRIAQSYFYRQST